MLKLAIFTLIFFSMIFTPAFGQTIPTTYRDDGIMTVFDGKWTFTDEWKRTAIKEATYENGFKQIIRIGHDFDYLYVLIDFISDTSTERFADRGIVCIDGLSDGGKTPKSDDYCFLVVMGSENVFTLQGGHILAQKGSYKKIENHSDLIGIGGISDKNDRYSKTPHSTYEFRIPIEIFGRSDHYGFYFGSFDAETKTHYNWPTNSTNENYPFIPVPDQWGMLFSPDKSIPEFSSVLLFVTLLIGIMFTIFLSKNKFDLRFQFKN